MALAVPPDEVQRIEALHRYGILDTPPEPVFDHITSLAAEMLHVPISLIAFVNQKRTWIKSRRGLEISEITREESIAAHSILQDETLAVPDVREDSRFASARLLVEAPEARAYAGVPLKTRDGFRLGTLCAIDTQPRLFRPEELRLLEHLAALVMDQLEMRTEARGASRPAETVERPGLRETAVDSAALGVAIINLPGVFVDVNPAYCRISGYSREELLGKKFTLLLPERNLAEVWRLHEEYMASGARVVKECQIRRKDGSLMDIQFTGAPFVSASGEHLRVSTLTDISALKKIEAQLRGDEKMEAVSRLAGGAAHGFNNLLTIITGYSQLVRNTLGESDPACAYVDEIARAAERAASLTGKLLALSRRRIGDPERLDINAMIHDVVASFRDELRKSIILIADPGTDLAPVLADRSYVTESIRDLLENARDAIPDAGKITVRTRMRNSHELRDTGAGLASGRYIEIEVEDTGEGIDPETQKHLFEPFFTTKGVGRGIGLATVFGSARQLGGDVRVESWPGRGTLVTLLLPAAR